MVALTKPANASQPAHTSFCKQMIFINDTLKQYESTMAIAPTGLFLDISPPNLYAMNCPATNQYYYCILPGYH